MSLPAVDTRNLEWKSNNVGAKMLEKMGWKNGQAVGKRQREDGQSISTEGLRVQKRSEGLGIGAASKIDIKSNLHAQNYAQVLASLKSEHATPSSTSSKKSKKKTVLPTNKSTHHKVREAKFKVKSEEDMKCIFGGADAFPVIHAVDDGAAKSTKKSKRSRDGEETRKKKKKKAKEEAS